MSKISLAQRAAHQAAAWETKLRRPSITTDELAAFRSWLDDEHNASAWDRLAAERHRQERFVVRRDATGFSIVDVDTAPAVVESGATLENLSGLDAKAIARRLNRAELDRRARSAVEAWRPDGTAGPTQH